MEKIVHLGEGPNSDIYCKIAFTDDRLSITGVEGPKLSGNCRGACGQIDKTIKGYLQAETLIFAKGWNASKVTQFIEFWQRWHLNDMQAGCSHQQSWGPENPLELVEYGWSGKFHDWRSLAQNGKLSVEDYTQYQDIANRVHAATLGFDCPKWPTDEIQSLLDEGWIEARKTTTKNAGLVSCKEHPEGLLGKPCPICGFKYGTAWQKEEVPQSVLDWLFDLPLTNESPAWV